MTLATDPAGGAYARASLLYMLRGDLDEARRCLTELTPPQHIELERALCQLLAINGDLSGRKADTGRRAMVAALLAPDDPILPIPDGVDGFAITGMHSTSVCTWCGRVDCATRDDHRRLHAGSETTWRQNARGTRT